MACNKKQTPAEVKPVPPKLPAASTVSINLPQNAAALVRSFYDDVYASMNAVLKHYENVKNQVPAYRNPIWTWTYNAAGFHITLEAVALPADSSSWKILVSGNALSNWISATGKAAADGKFGAWKFYMPNSTVLKGSFNWLKNDQKVLRIEATRFYDASPFDDLPGTYIDSKLVGQPDNSGSVQAFDQGVKIFEAMWGAAGAGWWAAYNSITGKQIEGGSWR